MTCNYLGIPLAAGSAEGIALGIPPPIAAVGADGVAVEGIAVGIPLVGNAGVVEGVVGAAEGIALGIPDILGDGVLDVDAGVPAAGVSSYV